MPGPFAVKLDSVNDRLDRPALSGTGTKSPSQSAAADLDVGEPEPIPRVLTWAVVKRIDPQLLNTWGHWWIELDDEESYGWWPSPCPMGWRAAMLGSGGCLNGIDGNNGGTPTRDAYHGEEPDHCFHPTLIADKTDNQVRAEIRTFAHSHVGGFRWQWWWLRQPAENCRTFQDGMFEAVGLFEEPEYLYSRGSGCPFMFPFRRIKWDIVDAIASVIARVLDWSPIAARRTRQRVEADPGEQTLHQVEREHERVPPELSDPRARARARIRGTLLPGEDDSAA